MKNFLKNIYKNNKKFIIAMVILVVVGNIGIFVKHNYFDTSKIDEFPSGMEVQDFDDYLESLKDVPSDIEGYSVYDKYVMGLQRQDGSDSDYDGLTDKEEIEVYGTDPLKASTAGDLYTDSYKINNNMDPFTYVEYAEEMVYRDNECPEVIINATIPSDFNAVIVECTNSYSDLSLYGLDSFIKGYEVYNYGGNICIDISKITNLPDDFDVYIALGPFFVEKYTKFEKCKYDINDSVITLNYDFDNHEDYYIYISEKKKFSVNGIFKAFYNPADKEDFTNLSGDDGAEAFVYGISLFNFLGTPVHIDYTECKLEKNTENFLEAAGVYTDQKILGGDKTYKKKYNSVNKKTLEIKKGFFEKFLSAFEYIPGEKDNSPLSLIFYYSTYKATYNTQEETNPYYRQVTTGFDKNIDELPFQNFQSYIGNGGNCAGITHLTSYLFNTKKLPSSGFYNCNINGNVETVNWNIDNNCDNATLMDPGLIDYKDKEFVDNNSDNTNNYIGSDLSASEMEFVKMIGCFWPEGNDRINMNDYELTYEENNNITLIDNMIKALDQGKVLDAYLTMRYGGAHAVNIYGYEWTDKNSLLFYVYDNNLPQDERSGFKLNESTCAIHVTIKKDSAGNEYFDYLYWPIDNLEYMATSIKGLMNTHSFVVMDENWNVFN